MKKDRKEVSTEKAASRKDLENALVFINNAVASTMVGNQKLSAHLYALTELLVNKQIVNLHELEERKQDLDRKMMDSMPEKWIGARMLADQTDKYDDAHTVSINCDERKSICRAACCKMSFYLSQQDVEEHLIRWDFRRPYHIAQGDDGYCTSCDESTRTCANWKHRPLICRTYDCRNDKRVWKDFDRMIPSDELLK